MQVSITIAYYQFGVSVHLQPFCIDTFFFFICEISVLYSTYNYTILYYNSIFILFAVILTFPTKVLCINALVGREE